jgi:hypothetical protein
LKLIWATSDFHPDLSTPELPIERSKYAYEYAINRDSGPAKVSTTDDRMAVTLNKDFTILPDRRYHVWAKTPQHVHRVIDAAPGTYAAGTPIPVNNKWHKDFANRTGWIMDNYVDEKYSQHYLPLWHAADPTLPNFMIDWEHCTELWRVDDPEHEIQIEQFILAANLAHAQWGPETDVHFYVPPKFMNPTRWPDSFTPEFRDFLVNKMQPIYAVADGIGTDFYATYRYDDFDGDGERLEKEWAAWCLDTLLMAAEQAGGKPTKCHLMRRYEWTSPTHANELIPYPELVDRFRTILDHRYNGDGVDIIVIWHTQRNDKLDLEMVNAVREARGLEPLTLSAGPATGRPSASN